MDQHFGYIDANRCYTLSDLAQIIQRAKRGGVGGKAVKTATVRQKLKEIGCPLPGIGDTVVVPGRLILLALERRAAQLLEEGDDE